mgnify:CR=1 FL=1
MTQRDPIDEFLTPLRKFPPELPPLPQGPLSGFLRKQQPWELEHAKRTSEQQLAGALWSMVIEYGGDNRVDPILPHLRAAMDRAIALLEKLGYYQRGKGFNHLKWP